MSYEEFVQFVQNQVAQISTRIVAEEQAILNELADASVDLSQIDSVGYTYAWTAGLAFIGGTFTITVLADKGNSNISRAYATAEVGGGPTLSPPTGSPEIGVIGYQGEYDEFAGLFVGIQGGTGVTVLLIQFLALISSRLFMQVCSQSAVVGPSN